MESIRLDLTDGAASCAFDNPVYDTLSGTPEELEKGDPGEYEAPVSAKALEAGFPEDQDLGTVNLRDTEAAGDGGRAGGGVVGAVGGGGGGGGPVGAVRSPPPSGGERKRTDPTGRTPRHEITKSPSGGSHPEKGVSRRRLCLHQVCMLLLALLLALGVSLAVAFLFRPYMATTSQFSSQALASNQDLNGCRNSPCDPGSACFDTSDGYYCVQIPAANRASCAINNGDCEDLCIDNPDGARCACAKPGFDLAHNNRTCIDINECSEAKGPCEPGSLCLNTYGSYHCLPNGDPGVTYVRWGRSSCDARVTELVYSGIAAGQHYNQVGGAANYLCLPHTPEWGNFTLEQNNETLARRNVISGCEYEKEDKTMFPFSSKNAQVLDDQDAPCAVCRARRRTSHVMIPARWSCPAGWVMEYRGYLMSEYYEDARSEFICVDRDPETLGDGEANFDGIGMFLVLGKCGSLQCPPYDEEKELTCVVCTK